ncbi:unnamed protein product [Knipowitschia caucasica]
MAEKEQKTVYRSVSFKKLGSWSANNNNREEPQHTEEAAEVATVPLKHTAPQPSSQSRKVSKIRATSASLPTTESKRESSTPIASISPSIRQLSEKFSSSSSSSSSSSPPGIIASPRDRAAGKRGRSTLTRIRNTRKSVPPSRHSFLVENACGYVLDSDSNTAKVLDDPTDNKVHKVFSGTDSVSGSDSERRSEKKILIRVSIDSHTVPVGHAAAAGTPALKH